MLTKNGYDSILKTLMESSTNPEAVSENITRLQSDFEESRGFLSAYGEVIESEDEEYEFIATKNEDVDGLTPQDYEDRLTALQGDLDRISQENSEIKKAYSERFFGTIPDDGQPSANIEEKEPRSQTFEDLIIKED